MEILVVSRRFYNSHDVKLFLFHEYLNRLGFIIFDGKKQYIPKRSWLNLLTNESFFLIFVRVLFYLVIIKIDLNMLERIEMEMFYNTQ